MNGLDLQARVEDVSDTTAAVALQGPTSRSILEACAQGDVAGLKYFRVMPSRIAGIPVEISRTGYTGDLGYEVWVEAARAERLWDALMEAGRPYDITPTGMLALDVARIEAGLILLDVDYVGAKKVVIPSQTYSPYEIGLGRLVHLDKAPFVGQAALRRVARDGPPRQLVGLEVDWPDLERLYDEAGLAPQLPATASPGGKGHEQHLVPHPQEDDRAGHGLHRRSRSRHAARNGAHRRPSPPEGGGHGGQAPVLRPATEAGLTDQGRLFSLSTSQSMIGARFRPGVTCGRYGAISCSDGALAWCETAPRSGSKSRIHHSIRAVRAAESMALPWTSTRVSKCGTSKRRSALTGPYGST